MPHNFDGTSSSRPVQVRPDQLQILSPTALEYWAARRILHTTTVIRSGVKLSRHSGTNGKTAIICGMAGGLDRNLLPGTVAIPRRVGLPDGRIIDCDPTLVRALSTGARTLGFEPDFGLMLTSPTFVTGPDREFWFRRGFAAADMETGLLAARGLRVATVRVILDSPVRNIAEDWVRPGHAILRPSSWADLFWLCGAAPSYSLRAAQVLRAGLRLLGEASDS
jgi:hypothetical protein